MDSKITMTKDYSSNSASQKEASVYANDCLRTAIHKMFTDYPERFNEISLPFNIADLGCSTGTNSILPLKTCINTVREINSQMPICIYLNDTPSNDFNVTISNVQKEFLNYNDVNVFGVSKSFYERLFPDNFVDLTFCLSSTHWVRKVSDVHSGICFYSEDSTNEPEVRSKWRAIGEEDWEYFMNLRQKEIRKYGRILISSPVSKKKFLEEDQKLYNIFVFFMDILKEFLRMNNLENHVNDFILPVVVRHKDELLALFEQRKTCLNLEHYEEKKVKFPFNSMKIDDEESKNLVSMRITSFIEAISGGIIKGAFLKHLNDVQLANETYKRLYSYHQEKNLKNMEEIVNISNFDYYYLIAYKS